MVSTTMVYNKYRNAFEQKCFRLIIEAYQVSLSEKVIQLDWNENDISYELYEKIEANTARIKKYKIHISTEFRISKNVAKIKGFADKLPRIDLKMSNFALEQEFKYLFEAKNLKENDSKLKRRYIKTGIDSFINGKYPYGFLIGYLLEGTVTSTIEEGVNKLLRKDKRDNECLEPKDHKIVEHYYESCHSKLILKHLILDFTVLP